MAQRVDDDVTGADRAMGHTPLVQVVHSAGEILDDPAEFLEPLRLPRRQRFPAGIAGEQPQSPFVVGESHETDDPGVVEITEERSLAAQGLGGSPVLDGDQLLTVEIRTQRHTRKNIK